MLHARENDKQFDESLGRLDMEHGFFATGAWALRLFWCKAERAVTTRHEMQPNAPRQDAAFIWVPIQDKELH